MKTLNILALFTLCSIASWSQAMESRSIFRFAYKKSLLNHFRSKKLFAVAPLAMAASQSPKKDSNSVRLKNDSFADAQRVDEVWNSLGKIKSNPGYNNRLYLWRACLKCIRNKEANCSIKKNDYSSDADIAQFDALNITKDGFADKQTQNIIACSYSGTGEGKLWEEHYPVKAWYEWVPGWRIGKLVLGK